MVAFGSMVVSSTARAATDPSTECQSRKNAIAGRYAQCRQQAEGKLAGNGDATGYANKLATCAASFAKQWTTAEEREAAKFFPCPSTGDEASMQARIDAHTSNVASALGGGPFDDCPADLEVCAADLASCVGACPPMAATLATGQTGCWDAAGAPIACAGSGQDGELQRGLARAYVDNGDGTITDAVTGLMWEKLSDDGSIHDADAAYGWPDALAVKLATLNTSPCFAGHCDWRVPNVNELISVIDYSTSAPAVPPAFNSACVPGCDVTACSCTRDLSFFWSSSFRRRSFAPGASLLAVWARTGGMTAGYMNGDTPFNLRAVRGGP
jgi:hypothetical protein